MKYIPITMVKPELTPLPEYPLPEGYSIRNFRPGDETVWAAVEALAGEFKTESDGLTRFEEEFGPYLDEMQNRCFFLVDKGGRDIGTATAWYSKEFLGETYGRLHWVGIIPEYQGKKLAKPLVARAVERMGELHQKAYLTSQTTSFKAIKIYLDFGFVPLFRSDSCLEAWRLLADQLDHPVLNELLSRRK